MAAPAIVPAGTNRPGPPGTAGVDLRTAAAEVIRDLIRRDPVLWARVQQDPILRRDFGFDQE